MTTYLCELLAKYHDCSRFRCGVPELDDYLRRQASQDMRRRVSVVFVMVPEHERNRVAGFYTLSAASVLLGELPVELTRKLPRHPMVPAILIERLARDELFPGLGQRLLVDALARSLEHSREIGAALVIVDARSEAAIKFYRRLGFQELVGVPGRLFLPMKTIEESFGQV